MISINDKVEEEEKPPDVGLLSDLLMEQKKEIRTIALFGDVDEEKAGDICMGLLMLTDFSTKEAPYDPITFYLSTYGGSADEMFSIYDMLTITKSKCEVNTVGLGKIMSAGTLLLAAGTKGKRKIGKHCRVMIHAVAAGSAGELHDIENEIKTIKHIQELYISALSKETSMTKHTIQKLLDRKVNVYLTAAEAVEYGIADEIIG